MKSVADRAAQIKRLRGSGLVEHGFARAALSETPTLKRFTCDASSATEDLTRSI
jgi:hypothetical protein